MRLLHGPFLGMIHLTVWPENGKMQGMNLFLTSRLQAQPAAAAFAHRLNPAIDRIISAHSPNAVGVWDVRQLPDGQNLYHFCLHDAWSHLHQHFSPDEISETMPVDKLIEEKFALFIATPRRVRFVIQSGTFATEELTNLRLRLNRIPGINRKSLEIKNSIAFAICSAYVATSSFDTREFTISVDASCEQTVKQGIEQSGFAIESVQAI